MRGHMDPNTLVSGSNLASVMKKQGRLDEAETLHRTVLRKRRFTLKNYHPQTVESMINLGVLLHEVARDLLEKADRSRWMKAKSLPKLVEAEALLTEAAEISRDTLGDGHMKTLYAEGNL